MQIDIFIFQIFPFYMFFSKIYLYNIAIYIFKKYNNLRSY